jgi:hypothetical protein
LHDQICPYRPIVAESRDEQGHAGTREWEEVANSMKGTKNAKVNNVKERK